MKVTVIYASERTTLSSTYSLTQEALRILASEEQVTEFFLPKDAPCFCKSCYQCFFGAREDCPNYDYIGKVREAMNESELIIFAVPVFVLNIPAQLKALFDHFACEWMVHRPNEKMFSKKALIISSACGSGMKSAIKEVRKNMEYWGIAKVYSYGGSLFAVNWKETEEKKRENMVNEIICLAKKIKRDKDKTKVSKKVKLKFYLCRWMHKKFGANKVDVAHWEAHGWLDEARPWK